LRLFSFGGYGLALAALAIVVFGPYELPHFSVVFEKYQHQAYSNRFGVVPHIAIASLSLPTERKTQDKESMQFSLHMSFNQRTIPFETFLKKKYFLSNVQHENLIFPAPLEMPLGYVITYVSVV